MPSRKPAPTEESRPSGPITMRLGKSVPKPLQEPRRKEPVDVERLQSQADEEFRTGNYASAEQHFRALLPSTRLRALTGFQIYLCLLKQKKTAEAELLAGKFPTGPAARNPSGLYVRAAIARMEGRMEDSRSAIESARSQYPFICPLYDKALADASLSTETLAPVKSGR